MSTGKLKRYKAYFEGGLGPTKGKVNPIPTIFDFPKQLQPKKSKTTPGSGGETIERCDECFHEKRTSKAKHT